MDPVMNWINGDVNECLQGCFNPTTRKEGMIRYDIVFIDPPYRPRAGKKNPYPNTTFPMDGAKWELYWIKLFEYLSQIVRRSHTAIFLCEYPHNLREIVRIAESENFVYNYSSFLVPSPLSPQTHRRVLANEHAGNPVSSIEECVCLSYKHPIRPMNRNHPRRIVRNISYAYSQVSQGNAELRRLGAKPYGWSGGMIAPYLIPEETQILDLFAGEGTLAFDCIELARSYNANIHIDCIDEATYFASLEEIEAAHKTKKAHWIDELREKDGASNCEKSKRKRIAQLLEAIPSFVRDPLLYRCRLHRNDPAYIPRAHLVELSMGCSGEYHLGHMKMIEALLASWPTIGTQPWVRMIQVLKRGLYAKPQEMPLYPEDVPDET